MPSWATPNDFATGHLVTAADWNTYNGTNGNLAFLFGDTGWTNMTGFTNSWISVASPYTARYRLAGTFVTIQGAVTGGTASTAITTLPAAYRPTQTVVLTTSNGGGTFAAISITSAGVISQLAGSNSNLHLSSTFSVL